MLFLHIFLWLIPIAAFLFFFSAAFCFLLIFYNFRFKEKEEYPIPKGEIYEPYREDMINWIKEVRALPKREFSIRSFDGLTLRALYYECDKDAPIEVMMHGYRGTGERDLSGGVARCFALKHNALIIDHRASGQSDGHVITFGVYESRDCLKWVDLVLREINPNAKIILTGISMGASTVLVAASNKLPDNVVGVLADCGFTSPHAIWRHVVKNNLHLTYYTRERAMNDFYQKNFQTQLRRITRISNGLTAITAALICLILILV
jgi:predicted alpha/beta-fold hydrolase